MDSEPVADCYTVLQVDPDCSAKELEAAYRHLAKMYHPDHPETADADRFNAVVEAYRVLRSPDRRAQYDQEHGFGRADAAGAASPDDDDGASPAALSDAEAHAKILALLYQRRREHAQNPGVIGFYIQDMLQCGDDSFEFHAWYLKAKGFIEATENGTLAITIAGVDHVISTSQTRRAEKLRIGQSDAARSA